MQYYYISYNISCHRPRGAGTAFRPPHSYKPALKPSVRREFESEEEKMSNSNTGRHAFSFEGGEQLTKIGATFFVSCLYHRHIDSTHRNWDSIRTQKSRTSTINSSESYHQVWLEHIRGMNDANLNKNTLVLDAANVKKMALAIQKAL